MSRKNKIRKLGYWSLTILLALPGILDLSLVIQLVLSHGSFFDISRRLFWGIIFINCLILIFYSSSTGFLIECQSLL
jgi:hypothetical protein